MKAQTGTPPATAFASCAPGLEHLLVRELRQLGLAPRPEAGGCSFDGTSSALYRANLFLRTANRVLLRRADFHTGHFSELEKRAASLPWKQWLPAGTPTPIVNRLSELSTKAIRSPAMQKFLNDTGSEAVEMNPSQLAAHQAAEIEKMTKLLRAAGVQPQ